jgi:activator of HSP90 ATPase
MTESLECTALLPASPEVVYHAWLDSEAHALFTGSSAQINASKGGKFTAWDGYIQGTTLELEPFHRIVQTWRTSDFLEDAPDSRLELLLSEEGGQTRITLIHTKIPEGQAEEYRQGWEDYYFKPMQDYFSR